MEVLGAVASAVTLAQLAVKGVTFLQKIPEIQSDYSDLCGELAFIETIIRDAQQNVIQDEKSDSRPIVHDYIQKIVSVLGEISNDLEEIKAKCERQTTDGDFRASKQKWVVFGRKVRTMLQKAHRAKMNLHMATSMHSNALHHRMSTDVREVNDQLKKSLPEIERQLSHMSHSQMIMISTQEQIINNKEIKCGLGIRELEYKNQFPKNDVTSATTFNQSTTATMDLSLKDQAGQKMALVAFRKTKCPTPCACRCHAQPWRLSSPHWIEKLTGSWELQYKPQGARTQWELRCPCSKSEDLVIAWRPPDWSLMRFLFPGHSQYSLKCSLRPTRVLLWGSSDELNCMIKPVDHLRKAMEMGMVVFPDDQDEFGTELVQITLAQGNFDVLEFLLSQWANILPGQRLSRNIGFKAFTYFKLNPENGNDREVRLVRQVLSYVDYEVDTAATAIHEAATRGSGVKQSLGKLQTRSHLVNALDEAGCAPLHLAAMQGHDQAMQELIDAGADINCKSFDGWTPLMMAAYNGHTDCIIRLLLTRRIVRIDEGTPYGSTALHMAALESHSNAVRLLLQAGASPTGSANFGSLPLHEATRSENQKSSEIQATLKILLEAPGTDIDGRDEDGNTAIVHAMKEKKLVAFHFLAQSGASFETINTDSENVLHIAARHGHLEILHFLHVRNLTCLNWKHRNKFGSTPWEIFMLNIKYSLAKPSPDEMVGFVQLYRGIRDRDLSHDISLLEKTLRALDRNDEGEAGLHLSTMIQHKEEYKNREGADFYRGVKTYLYSGDKETLLRCLHEDLQDLKRELKSSPWDQCLQYDEALSESDSDEFSDGGSMQSDKTDVEN